MCDNWLLQKCKKIYIYMCVYMYIYMCIYVCVYIYISLSFNRHNVILLVGKFGELILVIDLDYHEGSGDKP